MLKSIIFLDKRPIVNLVLYSQVNPVTFIITASLRLPPGTFHLDSLLWCQNRTLGALRGMWSGGSSSVCDAAAGRELAPRPALIRPGKHEPPPVTLRTKCGRSGQQRPAMFVAQRSERKKHRSLWGGRWESQGSQIQILSHH